MKLRLSSSKLALISASVILSCLTSWAPAQGAYPTHPLRLIVPVVPGGGSDTVARIVGARLGESLGQQVVVDNRPSGESIVASELTAKAPPDGHTLYLVSTAFTVAPSLQRKLSFDSLRDFAAITRLNVSPGALIVQPSLQVKSVRDLIALAKAKPKFLTFGSGGIGFVSHLGGELFKFLAGVDMLHVPYKGSSLVTTALLSGEVAVAFSNPVSSLPHVRAGRLAMVAVTTAERWPLLPDLPTIAESGVPGYELVVWSGLVVPIATPQPIIGRLHRELVGIMQTPEIAKRFAADSSLPMVESPQQFAAFLAAEIDKWAKVIKASGITPN